MAASCLTAKTTKNINRPCTPPVSGVRPVFYLGYLSQVTAIARQPEAKKIITGITLKTSEKLTRIEGYKTSTNPSTGFNATEYANFTPHVITFTVFDKTNDGLEQVDILTNVTDAFVIFQQNGQSGPWRVMGINTGMECTNVSSGFNDPNGGAVNVTLTAAQETVQPDILVHIANQLQDTDTYLAALAFTDV